MVHHVGMVLAIGGVLAAVMLPSSCNPLSTKKDVQATSQVVAARSEPREEGGVSLQLESAAKQYIMDLYSTNPAEVRRALSGVANKVGVSEGQARAAVADNQAKGAVKEVAIARQEVESQPPQGRSASVWFVMVRTSGTAQTGRLMGWQQYGQPWHFAVAAY